MRYISHLHNVYFTRAAVHTNGLTLDDFHFKQSAKQSSDCIAKRRTKIGNGHGTAWVALLTAGIRSGLPFSQGRSGATSHDCSEVARSRVATILPPASAGRFLVEKTAFDAEAEAEAES